MYAMNCIRKRRNIDFSHWILSLLIWFSGCEMKRKEEEREREKKREHVAITYYGLAAIVTNGCGCLLFRCTEMIVDFKLPLWLILDLDFS